MRITEAAQSLGTSPRMLRYRESLGLLPQVQPRRGRARLTRANAQPAATRGPAAGHRQFSQADLAAVALGLSIERRYDISPAALSFAIRVLADPRVRTEVAELGRRCRPGPWTSSRSAPCACSGPTRPATSQAGSRQIGRPQSRPS
jgi:MerR family copper efflux transcriptional regulator